MVDLCKCRLCGAIADRPLIFSMTEQPTFDFIFANPGCTATDIELALYGRLLPETSGLISTRIAHIRKKLRGTNWRVASFRSGKDRVSRYEVLQSIKVNEHVNVQSSNSIP